MSETEWDERYRSGSYRPREYPSPLLEQFVDWLPDGRALDVATGNGRNALFLAENGYTVDALDISTEALGIAAERAEERSLPVNWIHADYETELPDESYEVISGSFVRPVRYDRLADLKQLLRPQGVIVYEHHVTPPSSDNATWKWRSNDLLKLSTDLRVVYYSESERRYERGKRTGETAHVVTVVAQEPTGGTGSYPEEPPIGH